MTASGDPAALCVNVPVRRPPRTRVVLLAVVALAARLPLLDHPIPADEDEIRFIAGLGFPADYPVHHPGYPLWVAMGSALYGSGLAPYAAYQVWSVAASVVLPVLLYIGLRGMLADGLAWWLGAALAVNPLVWFQGTTALSYTAAAAAGLLIVGLCYRGSVGNRAALVYWAAGVLAVAVSLRADILIYLGPMVAYAACRGGWRRCLAALGILALGCGAFVAVVSFLYERGDPATVHPSLGHTIDVVLGTSALRLGIVDGLLRNLAKVALNLVWDYGLAVVALVWAAWSVVRDRRSQPRRMPTILLLWTAPIGLFLALMHVVQGYFMVLLPAGYCVIGLALQQRARPRTALCVAAAIALCSTAQFLFYPWSAESTGLKRLLDAKIAFQSASGLRQIDRRPEIHRPGDFWRTAVYDDPTTRPAGGQ